MRGAAKTSIGAPFEVLCAASPACYASDVRLGLFQPYTIFRSSLPQNHIVALTFNDGPSAYTETVLGALRRLHIEATFFVVGRMAHSHPDVLADIAQDGHLLANHSATHPRLDERFDTNPGLLIHQLKDVDDQITPLMAMSDKFFFRASYGYWRSTHAKILNSDPHLRKYIGPIYWDVGGETSLHNGYVTSAADWQCWRRLWAAKTSPKGYLREIRHNNGGVVLMHCTYVQAASLVEDVVPALLEEGYHFVRLDEVPEYQPYQTPSQKMMASAVMNPKPAFVRLSEIK